MSLKNFLAVGQSFSGGRPGKSPYELRKENLLPRFGSGSRGTAPGEDEHPSVQTDWLDETPRPQETATSNLGMQTPAPGAPAAQGELAPAPAAGPAPVSSPLSTPRAQTAPRKGLWYYLSFGFLRKARPGSPLVQSELVLDNVRVVRNDLADSDLELVVVKRKKKKVEPIFNPTVTNPHGNWNVLTARLFELGQKRR